MLETKYNYDYIQPGFLSIRYENTPPQICVLCGEVFATGSLKPCYLETTCANI